MKLNCDMGESFGIWPIGLDEAVMPWVDMANIACGFHASDPDVMAKTVRLALAHGVTVGAHPGYDDKKGFGRRSIPHSDQEISHLVAYQIGAMQAICRMYNGSVGYVKPHGALYNDMMKHERIFRAIVQAVAKVDATLPLMILARTENEAYQFIAKEAGVSLLYEAFADRAYTPEGALVPRGTEGAVHHNTQTIIDQVLQLAHQGTITAIDGSVLALNADTVCVHGDNQESVQVVQALRKALDA